MSAARTLADVGRDIATQDNRMTSLPIFMVQQRRRIVGIEPDDSGGGDDFGTLWMDEDFNEVDAGEAAEMERRYSENGWDGDGKYTRVGYVDIWVAVTNCFTLAVAEAYLAVNGHNLDAPRIYVASGYRNAEWELVREHLIALGKAGAA